jgi:hypothetical protein
MYILCIFYVYSQSLASYWSHEPFAVPILSVDLLSNREVGVTPEKGYFMYILCIFSKSGILLVTCRVYSQSLASDWSHEMFSAPIPSVDPLSNREVGVTPEKGYFMYILCIFSKSGILLVTCRVYSQSLASYWWSHEPFAVPIPSVDPLSNREVGVTPEKSYFMYILCIFYVYNMPYYMYIICSILMGGWAVIILILYRYYIDIIRHIISL